MSSEGGGSKSIRCTYVVPDPGTDDTIVGVLRVARWVRMGKSSVSIATTLSNPGLPFVTVISIAYAFMRECRVLFAFRFNCRRQHA